MTELKFPFINTVIISGRLTRAVDLRVTPGGSPVCNFSIANSRYFKDNKSETGFSERTTFINVVVWGDMAERLHKILYKGAPVIIEGMLEENRWEDRNTGQKRSRIEIRAQRVHLLSKTGADISDYNNNNEDITTEVSEYFRDGAGIEDDGFDMNNKEE